MLRKSLGAALQYGITEGFLPLRAWVADRLRARGIAATPESVVVVSGSQQGIDLTARVLLDPGATVLVENPSYLAALQAFAAYEVDVVALPGDADGLRTDLLEDAIREHRPALIYVVPEFQNPRTTSPPIAGTSWPRSPSGTESRCWRTIPTAPCASAAHPPRPSRRWPGT